MSAAPVLFPAGHGLARPRRGRPPTGPARKRPARPADAAGGRPLPRGDGGARPRPRRPQPRRHAARVARAWRFLFSGLEPEPEPELRTLPEHRGLQPHRGGRRASASTRCARTTSCRSSGPPTSPTCRRSAWWASRSWRAWSSCFARRPQVQERLTEQIASFLDARLQPAGVMVRGRGPSLLHGDARRPQGRRADDHERRARRLRGPDVLRREFLARASGGEVMTRYRYLIVGGGMAADAAVRGIRECDATGSIGLVGAEPRAALQPAAALEGALEGRAGREHLARHRRARRHAPPGPARSSGSSRRRTARPTTPASSTCTSRLLLATGGTPRRLPGGPATTSSTSARSPTTSGCARWRSPAGASS